MDKIRSLLVIGFPEENSGAPRLDMSDGVFDLDHVVRNPAARGCRSTPSHQDRRAEQAGSFHFMDGHRNLEKSNDFIK
jgi:hypothetical protein